MSTVTFPTSLGGNGLTYTDADMLNNGHETRFVTMLAQLVVMALSASNSANAASVDKTTTNSYLTSAKSEAATAIAKAAEAAISANAAQGYAALAQAVSPDSPMRLNTKRITADFTILADYNAVSAGPIEVSENITVTVNDGATWSIV